jgi:hypothetical protein
MKTVFHISSALILFTAMLIGSGYKKSDAPKSDTPAFQVAINIDPNLGKYPGDMVGRILYISQMIRKDRTIARVNVNFTGRPSMLPA